MIAEMADFAGIAKLFDSLGEVGSALDARPMGDGDSFQGAVALGKNLEDRVIGAVVSVSTARHSSRVSSSEAGAMPRGGTGEAAGGTISLTITP